MNPRIVLAIARKDATDILLNRAMVINLALPILIALLFWFINTLVGSHTNELLVYNPGQSQAAQVVIKAFTNAHVTLASSPAEVASAFGADGSHQSTPYAAGLSIPLDFDSSLKAGSHPQLSLYVNGDSTSPNTVALLKAAIDNYARTSADPQPPVTLQTTFINPPSTASTDIDISKFYAEFMLLTSFMVGLTFVPLLLIEEKEKKTLRMLMVAPTSFGDVIVGKLLVALAYQIFMTGVALAILNGFTGQVGLVVLFALLGACFSLALGLVIGAVFATSASASGVTGVVILINSVVGIFIGPLSQLLGSSSVVARIIKAVPIYYVGDGAYNAMMNTVTLANVLLDVGVVAGSTLLLLTLATWLLRRQAAVAATI